MTVTRDELQDTARRVFTSGDFKLDPQKSWKQLSDLGYLMTKVPEEMGGLGLSNLELGAIHYEFGRALVPGPLVSQFAAIEALVSVEEFNGRTALLEQALEGSIIATSIVATQNRADPIIDADHASHLILAHADQLVLYTSDEGLKNLVSRQTWDETRRLFEVSFPPTSAGVIIAKGDKAAQIRERMHIAQLFALAGDSLGGADAVLTMTMDYLKARRQFDRPLALFQALKHRVADLRVALSTADALYWKRADHSTSLVEMGSLKAHACDVFKTIAEEAIQLHGGIGLTVEYPCHLFLKRAFLNAALCGDSDHWKQVAGQQNLDVSSRRH